MNLSREAGNWLGWIGIILAVIGFFWQPVFMGIVALILGIIGVFSPQKGLNWTAIILAAIVLIVAMV
ncbi:MAG: hypothetical protein LRY71_18375 [Bacillaceae bacterium]|nr:hypothetical protein [Bacillaceae bacterium]